ncbi:MAG TPA: glycosyltransferase [Candidatus Paceibacterota bacterium]|nr:glycosyltransferase [Candidatus Paceibacterota bacterium]
MKLCFLADANSIHSFKWIEYFTDKDYEINWISLTPNSFNTSKDIKFHLLKNFKSKPLNILFNILFVRKLIRIIKPDVLHVHYAGVNGILGAFSGFYPFILTAWGSDILITAKSKVIKPLIKFVLKKADLITCDAEHMKKAMIKLGTDFSKIHIIYFGIDIEKFSPGPKDEDLKEKLEIVNSPVVISLRNLEPIYNVETLIRAIPIVLKEIPKVKFIIAGKGLEEEKLKSLSKELKVFDNIRFIGFVPNDELPKYLRTADVYISTSLSDAGIASSTAEAMACGLPLVITITGENKKWVKDGQGGYLIPVKNPKILAQEIINLIKSENLRKDFGKINREIIKEKNNYFKEMAKMEEIYRGLIEK